MTDAPSPAITIYVDADACPVKQETYRVAERHGVKVVVVSNSPIAVPREPFIERVVVASGMDKADDYIEGWAARAEFDDKSAKLKLYDKARLKSVQGEITGDVITYDTNKELFEVGGGPQAGMPSSRVKATLIPQKKGDAKGDPPKSAPPVSLKADTNPPGTN